jgi:histidinol-phosphate aminotransferase
VAGVGAVTAIASRRRVHGGPDADGPARWDFSTCANAAGSCPQALAAIRAADPTRYPDPAGTAVRQALAALHGVSPARVLLAASASEFIQRLTAVGTRLAPGPVQLPRHAYGDYAAAATAWGRAVVAAGTPAAQTATLRWWAEPSSPQGQDDSPPAAPGDGVAVLDAVYAPLRLAGATTWPRAMQDAVFVLHSPNKALGLTGVRGAYAIAPRAARFDAEAWCQALEAAAPSWPLSAQADAMLRSWATPAVQAWVAASLPRLARWKASLARQLGARGWTVEPSVVPFFVARPPAPLRPGALRTLRAHGVALRDTTSFGLPGAWRLSAQPPAAQAALCRALDEGLHTPERRA